MKEVRTRIAPSPTGSPHIGTIYQALFDYAFAKRRHGSFYVRLEDTDRTRFVKGAEEELYQALDWLEIEEDESPRKGGMHAPYRQSERLSIYENYSRELVDKEGAYYCFCTEERLKEVRKKQEASHKPTMYDKYCRNLSEEEVKKKLAQGLSYVLRLKIPENKIIVGRDLIRGEIKFSSNLLEDTILIKSDKFPTYHFASVVDDHLMQTSHVLRGEEWISSLPKHILLYEYFGWEMPSFIHTPLLRNPDRSKLSKRHNHTSIFWYKEQGFLPEAIINYLCLMGWSHPEGKDIFSLSEFIKLFDFKDLKAVGPIFDVKKLAWMNGMYIRKTQNSKLKTKILEQNPKLKNINDCLLDEFIPLAKERMTTLNDFYELVMPFLDKVNIDLSTQEKSIAQDLYHTLSKVQPWSEEGILDALSEFLKTKKIRMNVVYKIITGSQQGLPLPRSFQILGKTGALERLRHK